MAGERILKLNGLYFIPITLLCCVLYRLTTQLQMMNLRGDMNLFLTHNIVAWRVSTMKNILKQEREAQVTTEEEREKEKEKEKEREREREVMTKMLEGVTREGGEGLIMRQPRSFYVHGRSDSLIKIKTIQGDGDGLVVEVDPLILKLPSGSTIEIGDENNNEVGNLKKGDIVTFEYDTNTRRELPSNPRVTRVRQDVTWEQLLHDYYHEPQKSVFNEQSKGFTSKPNGFWTIEDNKNLRKLFENFAKSLNLNPHSPETWYSIPRNTFVENHGKSVLMHKGGYVKTILNIFPDIGLSEELFGSTTSGHWEDINNRRQFFNIFARKNQFDPNIPSNWYTVDKEQILQKKGGQSVLGYYHNSLPQALIHLFPDIGLQKSSLGYWREKRNQRKFFDQFAKQEGFDPQVPSHWYAIQPLNLRSYSKDIKSILQLYENSIVKALSAVYPSLSLDKSKFLNLKKTKNYWASETKRREFFVEIAAKQGFDPLVASNWYSITKEIIRSYKGGAAVVNYYGGYIKALQSLFPEIPFEPAKFLISPSGYWNDPQNQKEFFNNFARDNGFDPLVPTNWDSVKLPLILQRKSSAAVMNLYQGNLVAALKSVYGS